MERIAPALTSPQRRRRVERALGARRRRGAAAWPLLPTDWVKRGKRFFQRVPSFSNSARKAGVISAAGRSAAGLAGRRAEVLAGVRRVRREGLRDFVLRREEREGVFEAMGDTDPWSPEKVRGKMAA
jgi:hypothetical protein